MTKVLVVVLLLAGCGKAPMDNSSCASAFVGYNNRAAALTLGNSTATEVISSLGIPTKVQTANDGSEWYTYLVAADGTTSQVVPLCGAVELQFNKNILIQTVNTESYKTID